MQKAVSSMTAALPEALRALLASMVLPAGKSALALAAGAVASLISVTLLPAQSWMQSIVLSFALCWASTVDLDRQILPNILTLGLCVFGLAYAFLSSPQDLGICLIGALAGYGSFAAVNQVYVRLRGRSGLGQGDAKLLAAAGAWLGWMTLPYVVVVACSLALCTIIAGAAVSRGSIELTRRIPFGPCLAMALWSFWLAREGSFIS